MSGIVSLLDPASERAVRALWAELEERRGLREVAQRMPYPHCSYHVAQDYDLARLPDTLRRVAEETQPFAATITGLGAFEQPEPALYLAVERSAALDALHAALWRALAQTDIAHEPMTLYAPPTWVPHITLAYGDLTLETLRAIQAQWAGRDLSREVWVNDLAYAEGEATHAALLRFPLGGAD